MIILRPYQQKIIDDTRLEIAKGNRNVLIWAVTGAGKTVIASFIIRSAFEKNKEIWFCCPRKELIYQTSETLEKINLPHSFIAAGMPRDPSKKVHVCSVPTLARRLSSVKTPDLIIWDEAHGLGAQSYTSIYNNFPNAVHIGLSATPIRLDKKGLGDYFKSMVRGPEYSELMGIGSISKYKYYAPSVNLDLSHISKSMGDYNIAELAAEMNKPKITGDAIKEYNRLCPGKKAIVFAVNVEHSKSVCAEFNAAGIPALHVDGEIDAATRKKIIDDFRSGRVRVIVNCQLLTTGFDVTDIDACFLMRPTQSLSLYLQMVGRALRPHPGKEYAIIIDMSNGVYKHGFPDERREWTLEGLPKKTKKNQEPSVKVCEKCFAANENFSRFCTNCGHEFKVKQRSELKKEDGELVEVDKLALQKHRKMEQAMAKTLEELIEVGKKRGYKNPGFWASNVFNSRGKRR